MQKTNPEEYKAKIEKIRQYTQSLNVLVVEDDLLLNETMTKFFQSLFKRVDSAFDGKEALKYYKENKLQNDEYGIVFTDIQMPYMDGIELTSNIKKINKNQNIVVFSAYQESSYLLELINLGIRRFILKPVILSSLLDELVLLCEEIFHNPSQNILSLSNDITYNKEEKSIYHQNIIVPLTKYEQFVIEFFISKINQTVSNDDLVAHLYENMIDINLENIRKLIYKMRQKFPKEFIQSIHGVGYRITMSLGDNSTTK